MAPVEDRLTVIAVVLVCGFPYWSSAWTVIGPRLAVAEVAPETAAELKPRRFTAVAAATVIEPEVPVTPPWVAVSVVVWAS